MASFFAATAARRAHHILPSILAASAVVGSNRLVATTTGCEQEVPRRAVNIKTRMTSIGRFSMESETSANPSIPTFFISLVGAKPFTKEDFCSLWRAKGIGERHARFHQAVTQGTHFTPTNKRVEAHVNEVGFPAIPRLDLAYRIAKYLTLPMDLASSLWQVDVMSGPLGRSGAISRLRTAQLQQANPNAVETLLLLRSHHAMADGVSLISAVTELCDEWEDLQLQIKAELKKRRGKAKTLLQKLKALLQKVLWFWAGSIRAWLYQIKLLWNTSKNPFEIVRELSAPSTGRTLSWCEVTTVEEVKTVAAAFGEKVTINDIWVSCVAYAVSRQLHDHRRRLGFGGTEHATINVVIPVHLQGGMLLPGQSLGNRIGAFAARIPGEDGTGSISAGQRLKQTHNSLYMIKQTPAALLAYLTAHVLGGILPSSWTQHVFRRANANSCAAVTNVKNAPYKLHIQGVPIEGVAGFLPLPPGIPIGVAVQSYAGNMHLSVTAEEYAVPEADLFLGWMVEEYQRLLEEANNRRAK